MESIYIKMHFTHYKKQYYFFITKNDMKTNLSLHVPPDFCLKVGGAKSGYLHNLLFVQKMKP